MIFKKKSKDTEKVESTNHVISFRLDSNDYQILRNMAITGGLTVSGLIRNLIYAFYKRNDVKYNGREI